MREEIGVRKTCFFEGVGQNRESVWLKSSDRERTLFVDGRRHLRYDSVVPNQDGWPDARHSVKRVANDVAEKESLTLTLRRQGLFRSCWYDAYTLHPAQSSVLKNLGCI
jgi:hypothetical protein